MSCKYTFIINPVAGRGKAAGRGRSISHELAGEPAAQTCWTEYAGHARELARCALSSGKAVIACGGDGTAHEIANALAGSKVCLGVLPAGTANDFIKSLDHGFGRDFRPAAYLRAGETAADLGRVSAEDDFARYFINSFGIGFTGLIARQVRRSGWLRGESAYLYALLRVLLGYAPVKMHIKLVTPDESLEIEESVFAFSIGNGRIEGGRFLIAPDAAIDDGLLDVCILKAIPRRDFFRYALKYMRGTQIHDSMVLYRKVRAVEIVLQAPTVMHMDGEVFENVGGRVRVESAPDAIRLLR